MQVESPFKLVQSDLFECEVHLEEICDILCIAATGKADSKQAHSCTRLTNLGDIRGGHTRTHVTMAVYLNLTLLLSFPRAALTLANRATL